MKLCSKEKAGIVCLYSGTDDIHYLPQHTQLNLRIGNQRHEFIVSEVDLDHQDIGLTPHPQC